MQFGAWPPTRTPRLAQARQILLEQAFRDTKNLRVGLGLDVARSRSKQRLEMLLLIADLASFVQRLIGESAQQRQL